MTKAFNAEWYSQGVKSILIAPGSMKTTMGKKVKNQDFNTFIEPFEVAKTIKNLLNDNKSMFIDEVKIKRKIYR
jgi:short-subunit dehydrogenase